MNFILARQRVDMQKFVEDLSNGDPVVWTITVVVRWVQPVRTLQKIPHVLKQSLCGCVAEIFLR